MQETMPMFLEEILKKKQAHKIRHNKRSVPLNVPALEFPLIIAEIKRASPSAGDIGSINRPIHLAKTYLQGGANVISVLCEQDYFKGDLEDLKAIKTAHHNACILRKDFITKIAQVQESYDFGADMVLLIAAVFMQDKNGGFNRLLELYQACLKLNLTPLVEVHNALEVEFIAPLNAVFIGVNARNLHNFKIDKIKAYWLLEEIRCKNPKAKVIFESSLKCSFDGFVVGNVGFDGILCGSYFVQSENPAFAVHSLSSSLKCGKNSPNAFYQNVFKLLESKLGFIKICGITNVEDALMCAEALCELAQKGVQKVGGLGFILEPKSPRFVELKVLKEILQALQNYPNLLKIAVIKDSKEQMEIALKLYKEGNIDALQLHGVKSQIFAGVDLKEANFAFYEAWNIEKKEDLKEFVSPFVLLDSKSVLGGGSGKCIDVGVLESLEMQDLCVAGGVGAENIDILKQMGAKMLDINSSIEKCVGKKDKDTLQTLIIKLKSYL